MAAPLGPRTLGSAVVALSSGFHGDCAFPLALELISLTCWLRELGSHTPDCGHRWLGPWLALAWLAGVQPRAGGSLCPTELLRPQTRCGDDLTQGCRGPAGSRRPWSAAASEQPHTAPGVGGP